MNVFPDCTMNRWEVEPTSYIADADNYYTKGQVDNLIDGISGLTPEDVEEIVNESISGMPTTEDVEEIVNESISGMPTTEDVDEKIASAKTEIESEIPSLSGYATEQWVEDKHYITGVDLSDYALKTDIPTSNSAFTNDENYITSAYTYDKQTIDNKIDEAVISGGSVTSASVQTQIDQSISGKTNQSDFSAHTANTTVHITSAERNTWNGKANVWHGTKEQYDAIQNKDANTIFLIHN